MPKIIEKVLHFMKIKKRFVQIFFFLPKIMLSYYSVKLLFNLFTLLWLNNFNKQDLNWELPTYY